MSTCKCGSNRILQFNAKCADLFGMSYGEKEYNGYVPTCLFERDHYGDYVGGRICLCCGQIQDWKKVSEAAINKVFSEGDNG